MNVWVVLPRLLASSRCPHNLRVLVEESLSSSIRHFSTNTPVPTKTPEDPVSQFSDLLKNAIKQADSKVHTQHVPRLEPPSDATIRTFKRRKMSKKEKKAAKRREKSKQGESRESTAEPVPKQELRDDSEQTPPPSQTLASLLRGFPTEGWEPEPWASTPSNLHKLVPLSLN